LGSINGGYKWGKKLNFLWGGYNISPLIKFAEERVLSPPKARDVFKIGFFMNIQLEMMGSHHMCCQKIIGLMVFLLKKMEIVLYYCRISLLFPMWKNYLTVCMEVYFRSLNPA